MSNRAISYFLPYCPEIDRLDSVAVTKSIKAVLGLQPEGLGPWGQDSAGNMELYVFNGGAGVAA